MVRALVRDPDEFLGQKATERGFRREVILLLGIGLLGAFGWVWLSQFFLESLTGQRDRLIVLLVGRGLRPFLGGLLLWVFYTLVPFVVAWAFKSRGPIRRIFKVSAWALVPFAVANIVHSVAIYLAFSDETIPSNPAGALPRDQLDTLFQIASGDPAMLISIVISMGVAVYTGYLLSIGLVHARDLSLEQARQAAAVPVALHVLYLGWVLLTYAGVL